MEALVARMAHVCAIRGRPLPGLRKRNPGYRRRHKQTSLDRHPEVLGACFTRRASKGDGPECAAPPSFEARAYERFERVAKPRTARAPQDDGAISERRSQNDSVLEHRRERHALEAGRGCLALLRNAR